MSQLFSPGYTKVLQEVIREIEVDPTKFLGAKYMPSVEEPANEVYVDVWEARGGMTQEYTLDGDPQAIQRRQFRTQVYSPGNYREFVRLKEKDILRLRQLGMNDQSKRGIRQHMNENALVLNNRIETRMEYLRWQTIFSGTYNYDGLTVDFGIPGANKVVPSIPWGIVVGGILVANPAANPIADLRYWVMGGYAQFRKYVMTKIIMNPTTARLFLDNPVVQSLIQMHFASDVYKAHDVDAVCQFLIPGFPNGGVQVYKGWYQSESIDNTTGQISVSNAVYFIPDGSIFFECELPDQNKIGDIVMTLNLANGSIDNPAPGKFILVDEHITNNPGSPYVDIFGGFAGGPRLKRLDVLTAQVV